MQSSDLAQEIIDVAQRAKGAARAVAKRSAEDRKRALLAMAEHVRAQASAIIEANALDLAQAEKNGLSSAMIDRLRLDPKRLDSIAGAIVEVAEMADLVGRIERESTRPSGIEVSRMRIPLGVICMIYESRPNVTTDAAALCIKAGNAVILRGGSEAFHSNRALGEAVRKGLAQAGLPEDAVQVVASTDRKAVNELLLREDEIDLVIPRGGEGLIRFVAANSRVPVLKHYKGVCHLYVHEKANLDMALAMAENGKAQRPGVCNALETILVDKAVADSYIPALCRRFAEIGVEVRGDPAVVALAEKSGTTAKPASDDDWTAEYLELIVAVRVVDGIEQAIDHIERYGSDHTESIITEDAQVAERFLREVGSSTVMVNASTRFADGGQLGLGAEIGISTSKLHAFGPMGAEGLTTTKFVVRGTGQIRH